MEDENKLTEEVDNFNIVISKDKIFFKIEITDDISISNYLSQIKLVDKYNITELLNMSILWDSRKQKINKGIYYVGMINYNFYNILVSDEFFKIDECIKIGDITEEKIVEFNLNTKDYSYSKLKHGKNGSTFYTKFYPFDLFLDLELPREEAIFDILAVINNLENINGIEDIIDVRLLKSYIIDNKLLRKQI